jgi:hypothetical protein
MGSKLPFEEAADELSKLLRIEINAKQVERLCHCYGEELEKIDWREAYSDGVQLKISYPERLPVYCMVDGSMLLTREDGWKEIKLGRAFSGASNIKGVSKDRGVITDSMYCAHFGTSSDFWERFSKEIPSRGERVFIADGAKWIWNYVDDRYPDSVQILDYYHCKEHIHSFVNALYGNNESNKAKSFIDQVMNCFDNMRVEEGIDIIKNVETKGKRQRDMKDKLMNYLIANKKRIDYGCFKEKGYLIGSGPIEAGHRNVLQKRLKLSGQRWTIKGAQQVANLRVSEKSNQWNRVIDIITGSKNAVNRSAMQILPR